MSTNIPVKFLNSSDSSYTQLLYPADINDTELRFQNLAAWNIGDKIILTMNRIDVNGNEVDLTPEKIYGEVAADGWLINCVRGVESSAKAHGVGTIAEDLMTSTHFEAMREGLLVSLDEQGNLLPNIVTTAKIATDAVTADKMADNAVGTSNIIADSITKLTEVISVNPTSTLQTPANNWWYDVPGASGSLTTSGGVLFVTAHYSGFKGTNTGNARFGFVIGSTNYRPTNWFFFFNDFNTHRRNSFNTVVTGLPAGTYTVKMQMYTDSMIYTVDINDPHYLSVLELKR